MKPTLSDGESLDIILGYFFSKSSISKIASRSKGSKYSLSEASKSVDTVSGLLFTTTASYPAFLAACTP